MYDLTEYTNRSQQTLQLQRLMVEREKLYVIYKTILPKVKPVSIDVLLSRETDYHIDDKDAPMYTIEVFTKQGIDAEQARMYILQKTGMTPSIYDHGTHYVTNQKLTLEILKQISDCDDVLEVVGEYSCKLSILILVYITSLITS
jgi:hypothetical protein